MILMTTEKSQVVSKISEKLRVKFTEEPTFRTFKKCQREKGEWLSVLSGIWLNFISYIFLFDTLCICY